MIKAVRARYEKQIAALVKELENVKQELAQVQALTQLRNDLETESKKGKKANKTDTEAPKPE